MGNTGNMRKRTQSNAASRTERLFCPVEVCGSGPYRSDKLWGKGGHMEQMAAKLDGNHSLLLDDRRQEQQREAVEGAGGSGLCAPAAAVISIGLSL